MYLFPLPNYEFDGSFYRDLERLKESKLMENYSIQSREIWQFGSQSMYAGIYREVQNSGS